MPKIHARMSVEIEVTEAEFKKIVANATDEHGIVQDSEIPWHMITRAKSCDWDDGGYIPGMWLDEDIRYEKTNGVEV